MPAKRVDVAVIDSEGTVLKSAADSDAVVAA